MLELDLLGGIPPHLAGMKSNAPWFTAHRAAVFIEAEEFAEQTFLDQLRASILGDR